MIHPSVATLALILPPPPVDVKGEYQIQVPPPLPECGGDRFDWEEIAARTGWRYPADYRCFLETYGAGGDIAGTIGVVETPHPADVEYHVDRLDLYPPPDGLRRWGCDDVADDFFWRCIDPDPDDWTVAVHTRDRRNGQRWFDYPMGMVDFLTGLLNGSLDVPLGVRLRPGSPQAPHTYQSWRVHDLQMRAEYPDFKGTWAPLNLPNRYYEA